MQIEIAQFHSHALLAIGVVAMMATFGFVIAQRWPARAWLFTAGIGATIVLAAAEAWLVVQAPLDPVAQRSVTIQLVAAVVLGVAAIAVITWTARRAHRALERSRRGPSEGADS